MRPNVRRLWPEVEIETGEVEDVACGIVVVRMGQAEICRAAIPGNKLCELRSRLAEAEAELLEEYG